MRCVVSFLEHGARYGEDGDDDDDGDESDGDGAGDKGDSALPLLPSADRVVPNRALTPPVCAGQQWGGKRCDSDDGGVKAEEEGEDGEDGGDEEGDEEGDGENMGGGEEGEGEDAKNAVAGNGNGNEETGEPGDACNDDLDFLGSFKR